MALKKDYEGQNCSIAKTLEAVGERWTLLIVRDCFFGVRRFSDLQSRLGLPRAVLTARLNALVEVGVLRRERYQAGRDEYLLTEQGRALWPTVFALSQWGDTYDAEDGKRRIFSHQPCGSDLDDHGRCTDCASYPAPTEITMRLGPGATPPPYEDALTEALSVPRALLEPVRRSPSIGSGSVDLAQEAVSEDTVASSPPVIIRSSS